MGMISRILSRGTPPPVSDALQAQGMSTSADFGPGTPIAPWHGYSTRPRAYDYPVGANINLRPRAAYGRPSFDTLRAIIDAWDLARICINHKIDDLRSMEPLFLPAEGAEGDVDTAVEAARAALEFPDRDLPFESWLSKWLEGVWRYDAGTLYRRRDRAGRVIGLEVVDGTTILPYIDGNGRKPRPPAPAYAQIIKGVGYEWLTTDDLIYAPFRPQLDSPYGLAPVESILLTANTDLRFQKYFLDYFTAGSLPGGFLHAPEDATTPDQVAAWQDFWDALMLGDQEALRQIKVIPKSMDFTEVRNTPFDENFPIYLMRRCCAAFGVTPQDLGITLDVNRANGETQVDVQARVNTRPGKMFVEGVLSRYLQTDLGLPVRIRLDDGQEREDRLNEAKIWQIGIDSGMVGVDEGREELFGLPTDNSRPVPRFINNPRTGPVPLASLYAIAGPIDPKTGAPVDDVPLSETPFDGAHGVLPDKAPGGTQFKRAPIDPDEPDFPALERPVAGSDVVGTKQGAPVIGQPVAKAETAGVTAETGIVGYDLDKDDDDDDEDDVEVAKAAELAAYRKFSRRPRKRAFVWAHHSPEEVVEITKADWHAHPSRVFEERLVAFHAARIRAALGVTVSEQQIRDAITEAER